MGQTAIDGVEGLNRAGEIGGFSGSRSVALPPIPFWPCLLRYCCNGRSPRTVAHRHVDHAGTMCADHVAQFRSSQATAAIVLAIILLILLIADMACYLAYYHLPPMPAFIDGTTPLIAVTVFSEIVVTMIV